MKKRLRVSAEDEASARSQSARRWCNHQSAPSAIRPATAAVLIALEAMHDAAAHDGPELLDVLASELRSLWGARVRSQWLTKDAPRFGG